MITDIIGKKFRRNVYGLSTWIDAIKEIHYVLEVNSKLPTKHEAGGGMELFKIRRRFGKEFGYKVIPKVIGYNTVTSYDLDEIIIYV